MKILAMLIATVFGAGKTPKAPGTAGALVAVLLIWLLSPSVSVLLLIIIISSLLGTWASWYVEKNTGLDDPGFIVIDEFAGQAIAMLLLPSGWLWVLTSFILFRFFDILKPWPINISQEVPYGIGVMLDDILSGFFAFIIIQSVHTML